MADFWGMLGKSIPKKGYSKYGKSLDRKLKVKRRKRKPAPRKPAPKQAKMAKEKPLKWRPFKTFDSREKAFSMAKHLKETDGYQTRVDGTGRGYQVWIKS